MDATRLWIGLVSFVLGLVLWANQGNIFYNPNSYSTPSGLGLFGLIVFQALVLIMVFGGLILIVLSWKQAQPASKPKAAKMNQ